ncbi:KamA family radical SAM protein [Tichowtungia aerotolerans]|uniref:KamA family radical SAM protein n=1 Tax=Tichowtungia aerotolerans TaxID=2697043 RepID=A0A6P1MFZ0_9BACT|nr:KamA family radical SAM protein [Tichowtungia aerotolerans]QHI70526.1 KamA family radical SAM protein [Tichowtungia aerotolerans]
MSHLFQNCKLTSYYKHLLETLGNDHPLCRTVLPINDRAPLSGELADPLGEEKHRVCPGLIHTYPDKVLLLATLKCAVYCQYCTRGRLVGPGFQTFENSEDHDDVLSNEWKLSDNVFQTLENLKGVRDVLISGGDPLTLPDAELDAVFSKVRKISHIRTVRLGSKVPAVMPERITPKLAGLLTEHRIWLQLHFIHPAELTEEVGLALDTLAEAGVPMVAQTVLLKGINDDADTLTELFYGLLENRVKPYYLFQCDPVLGSSSFRTPVQKGLDLMQELQGRGSGLALPNFCIDAPGGGGKIVLHPGTVLQRKKDSIVLTNYQGKEYLYPDNL